MFATCPCPSPKGTLQELADYFATLLPPEPCELPALVPAQFCGLGWLTTLAPPSPDEFPAIMSRSAAEGACCAKTTASSPSAGAPPSLRGPDAPDAGVLPASLQSWGFSNGARSSRSEPAAAAPGAEEGNFEPRDPLLPSPLFCANAQNTTPAAWGPAPADLQYVNVADGERRVDRETSSADQAPGGLDEDGEPEDPVKAAFENDPKWRAFRQWVDDYFAARVETPTDLQSGNVAGGGGNGRSHVDRETSPAEQAVGGLDEDGEPEDAVMVGFQNDPKWKAFRHWVDDHFAAGATTPTDLQYGKVDGGEHGQNHADHETFRFGQADGYLDKGGGSLVSLYHSGARGATPDDLQCGNVVGGEHGQNRFNRKTFWADHISRDQPGARGSTPYDHLQSVNVAGGEHGQDRLDREAFRVDQAACKFCALSFRSKRCPSDLADPGFAKPFSANLSALVATTDAAAADVLPEDENTRRTQQGSVSPFNTRGASSTRKTATRYNQKTSEKTEKSNRLAKSDEDLLNPDTWSEINNEKQRRRRGCPRTRRDAVTSKFRSLLFSSTRRPPGLADPVSAKPFSARPSALVAAAADAVAADAVPDDESTRGTQQASASSRSNAPGARAAAGAVENTPSRQQTSASCPNVRAGRAVAGAVGNTRRTQEASVSRPNGRSARVVAGARRAVSSNEKPVPATSAATPPDARAARAAADAVRAVPLRKRPALSTSAPTAPEEGPTTKRARKAGGPRWELLEAPTPTPLAKPVFDRLTGNRYIMSLLDDVSAGDEARGGDPFRRRTRSGSAFQAGCACGRDGP
ncbi:MAG: hypothetical protein BJ554DRAFT_2817, partial [Olpidium bornovanus]